MRGRHFIHKTLHALKGELRLSLPSCAFNTQWSMDRPNSMEYLRDALLGSENWDNQRGFSHQGERVATEETVGQPTIQSEGECTSDSHNTQKPSPVMPHAHCTIRVPRKSKT